MKLTRQQITALRDAESKHQIGWLPSAGSASLARELAKDGLLCRAGVSVMPPHTLYVLTKAGRDALAATSN